MCNREPTLNLVPQAETKALKNMTGDSEKLLTEKLDLTRQLSTFKPELEHLRAQVSSNATILGEKLALQRQLSEVQVQLEHAKSDVKRAQAKRRNTTFEIDQEEAISDLNKSLTREKRLREKAEQALESVQAELELERSTVQRNMAKDVKRVEDDAGIQVELEEARRQLAAEKKEKDRSERNLAKSQQEWEATKALLDDKLGQFRSKLKTTKERLRDAESQLSQAQEAAAASAAIAAPAKQAKKVAEKAQPKKRKAGEIDPDSQKLGTPGQGKPTKRGRTKAAAVGDKSTFSITPFLNRTMSVAADTPDSDKERQTAVAGESESEEEEEADASDVEPSPAAAKAKAPATKARKQPLATVPASKANIKKPSAARAKKALDAVVEEEEPASQPAKPASQIAQKEKKTAGATSKIPLKGGDDEEETAEQAKPISKQKVRKSLATFTSFMLDPEPAAEKKQKKRKLGGLGKTLFDEDDDAGAAANKPLPGRNAMFGGARGLGPFGALKGGSILAGARVGGGNPLIKKKAGGLMEHDGFQFSPLKRNRGGADASFMR